MERYSKSATGRGVTIKRNVYGLFTNLLTGKRSTIDLDHYYFDVLQLHPPPEYLESLTSYLTRIAEMNGIDGYQSLATLCLPTEPASRVRTLKDYPLSSFSTLGGTTVKPEATLLKTTFYHLAKKFECSTEAKPLSIFLSRSVADCLRYCPLCLGDFPYYSLAWRFLALKGCWVHNCQLLEKCGHCGTKIPIFTRPFKAGFCPTCKKELRTCKSSLLSEKVRIDVQSLYQNLEFLLAPQPFESMERTILQDMGQESTNLRNSRNLTQLQMSQQAGISVVCLISLEHGHSRILWSVIISMVLQVCGLLWGYDARPFPENNAA